MKFFTKIFMFVCVVLGFAGATFAATTPSLGTAADYGVLASTYTNTIGGVINGDVSYTTAPVVLPTINGTTVVPKDSQAGIDQNAALVDINSQPCDFSFDAATDLSLLPQPLTPGVYCITAAASIGAGGVTLNGVGTYIFKISGAFDTVANSVVSVAGSADACDIFWAPNATTLGANSTFIGTVIDNAGITVGDNVTWFGRALNFATTITTNNSTITVPICTVSIPVTEPIIEEVVVVDTGTVVVDTGTVVVDTGAVVSPFVPKLPKTGLVSSSTGKFAIFGAIFLLFGFSFVAVLRKRDR